MLPPFFLTPLNPYYSNLNKDPQKPSKTPNFLKFIFGRVSDNFRKSVPNWGFPLERGVKNV